MPSRAAARYPTVTAVLLLLGLPALYGQRVGARMWALAGEVDTAAPYFSTQHPGLLYLAVPLSVLGALVLVLAPGLLLALALDQARSFETWLLKGFCWSLLVLGVVAAAVQGLTGRPLVGPAFCAAAMACSLAAGGLVWARGRRRDLAWPEFDAPTLVSIIAFPLLLVVALTPKFFWESLNGDGAHAFEAARLLLHRPLPFWPAGAGHVSPFPGLNSSLFCYPTAWFLRIFGEYECGVRLPYLLFLVLFFAGLMAVAREPRVQSGPARTPGGTHNAWVIVLVWISLASYSLVMAYSATYDPYCSDIGLPATQDTLLLVCFLGLVVCYLRQEWLWVGVFTLFCLLASPGGPLLAGGWWLALAVGSRRRNWGQLARFGTLLAAAVLLTALLPRMLELFGLPAPGKEHTTGALLSKFRYAVFDDFRRVLWVVVPAGSYPAAVLFSWRRADDGTRALLVLWLLTFVMYYFMAFVALHYFVPAMLLPLVAFWRHHRLERWAKPEPMLLACYFAALVALGLGTPQGSAIYTGTREVGSTVDARGLPGYATMEPQYFHGMDLLEQLFVPGWNPEVPARAYAGSAAAWSFYAQRARPGTRREYALLPPHTPAPPGGQRIAANEDAVLYVRDRAAWEAQRALQPADSNGRALYAVPRDVLFHREGAFEALRIIDIKDLLKSSDDTEGR